MTITRKCSILKKLHTEAKWRSRQFLHDMLKALKKYKQF
jgi:hypothetical protein